MSDLTWTEQYIGIPFVPCGRDRSGCDCYGLVRLVEKERFGVDLPLLDGKYHNVEDYALIQRVVREGEALIGATRVEDPRPGDIVEMRYFGQTHHVGVYLGDGLMLHVGNKSNGAVVEKLTTPLNRDRIDGYYRVE